MPYRETVKEKTRLSVIRTENEGYKTVVVGDGEIPEKGQCSSCGHARGYVTWWCKRPDRDYTYCGPAGEQWVPPPRLKPKPNKWWWPW